MCILNMHTVKLRFTTSDNDVVSYDEKQIKSTKYSAIGEDDKLANQQYMNIVQVKVIRVGNFFVIMLYIIRL